MMEAPFYTFTLRVFVLLVLFIQPTKAEWIKHNFDVMGTRASVEFEAPINSDNKKTIELVEAEMHRIDLLMSPFKSTSELSKVNRLASTKEVKISKELFDILLESNRISELTHGAFDISFSSVGFYYDYRKAIKPSKQKIESLKKSINYHLIKLNRSNQSVRFLNENIKIDLGGIAKGYSVDQCIDILKGLGIKNAYVSAGGDSRVIGKKQNRLWYIGIKDPRNRDKLIANLPLEDVSISTSGDYERFFIKDGVRYHHIIDPKTGDSARALESVTILAPKSIKADGLSTSVFVLGKEKGLKLINSLEGISAIIVDAKGQLYFSNDLTQIK